MQVKTGEYVWNLKQQTSLDTLRPLRVIGTVTYAYSDTPECYNRPCFTLAARERQEAGQQAD
jgi:hypothetical protein